MASAPHDPNRLPRAVLPRRYDLTICPDLGASSYTGRVVIDLDVHQGNGSAALFADDPATFTFSMHQEEIYPSPKVAGTLDIGLAAGTTDAEYLAALAPALDQDPGTVGDSPEGAEFNQKRDLDVLTRLDLAPGSTLRVRSR